MENWNLRHDVTQPSLMRKAQVKNLTAQFEKWISDNLPPLAQYIGPDWIGLAAATPGAPAGNGSTALAPPAINGPVDFFRRLQKARNRRTHFFGGDLFVDPAWDIMIDLYIAAAEHKQISISSACMASGAPPTTALRYLATLTDAGIIIRAADARDGRRFFVRLSDDARQKMTNWYESTGFA
ncbi:hypothetical protein K3M67_20850 (plasmid) [Sphingobium sp. V4]|uniref:hypothetical protein n=1 Tax=Sphingobium sp. V4 TaxID=3038927 RepID=UPI002557D805|nr:hypothetical protein [Sphingobium sp. V4]WIW90465.1 hypothetical protein K3M67_20850 [Sphingobium sp. V4]